MCLYPKLIQNPKYRANKKNGGVIPAITDIRVTWVPIGCKQCIECRKQKAREWQLRLLEEVKEPGKRKFVTLTFSDEWLEKITNGWTAENGKKIEGIKGKCGYMLDNEIATRAVRWFLERWRKKYKVSLRHWLITELGQNKTERIHMHGIVWTDDLNEVEKIWQYGHVWKGKETNTLNGKLENYVNAKTVNYLIKYVHKMDEKHKGYMGVVLTSPGMGRRYTTTMDAEKNKYKEGKTIEHYRTEQGAKVAMPIYWRNKIYTEQEREKLWVEKLDKEERWVCGQKVDISKGMKEYNKVVEYHRRRNKELGYGDDEQWNKQQYEKASNMIRHGGRIRKEEKGL